MAPGSRIVKLAPWAADNQVWLFSSSLQVASYPGRHGDSSHWSWSTINNNFASVACRQLGLRAPGRVVPNAVDVYGEGKGAVLLSNVVCLGNELALQSCAHDGWGSEPNPLGHRHDVGIVCNGGPLP